MVENGCVIIEDVWSAIIVEPQDLFFKKINSMEFLDEEDMSFLKKYFQKIDLENNLSTEHLLYLKTEKLIDWFLIKREWKVKNSEIDKLKRQLIQLEKEVGMLKIGKEKSFLEI